MDVSTFLGLGSGAAILGVGGWLLAVRSHARGATSAALFLVAWGASVVLANALNLETDSGSMAPTLCALQLSLLATAACLVLFGAAREPRLRWLAVGGVAILAIVAALFLLSPQTFARLHYLPDGKLVVRYSVWATIAISAPFFGAFYVALAWVGRQLRSAASGIRAAELRVFLLALLCYLAYASAFYVTFYAYRIFQPEATVVAADAVLFAVFLVGTLTTLLVGVRAYRHAPRAILAIALVAAVVGFATALPLPLGGAALRLQGVARLATALVIAYGVVKHHLFGIDLGLKRGARRGVLLAPFGIAFFAVDQGAQLYVSTAYGVIAGLAAAAALIFLLEPLKNAAHNLADRAFPGVEETPEYAASRKIILYRAAAESAAARGFIGAEARAVLDRLRLELGIGAAEAAAVERDAGARPA